MKMLWIFTLFLLLMLGTNLLVNWLFGSRTPWEATLSAFHTMRPSEYIVLAGMLLLIFISVGKKQIRHVLHFFFSQWLRFLKVPAPSPGSGSASSEKSSQQEQQGKEVNK